MTKHDYIASILWGLSAGFVMLTGTDNPTAMAALGFCIAFGLSHQKAQAFRFRSVFAGVFGFMAAWAAMGYLHMDGTRHLFVMGLLFMVFTGAAWQIAKGGKVA